MRSTPAVSQPVLVLGRRRVHIDRLVVETGDASEPLTPIEGRLLDLLAAHDGAVSRETLLSEVWGYDPTLRTRAVHHCVTRLRRKIEDDPSSPRYLRTVRGFGYRLCLDDDARTRAAPARHTAGRVTGSGMVVVLYVHGGPGPVVVIKDDAELPADDAMVLLRQLAGLDGPPEDGADE